MVGKSLVRTEFLRISITMDGGDQNSGFDWWLQHGYLVRANNIFAGQNSNCVT